MEVLVKEKEKDLEKAEVKGCLLIQDKKGEAGSVIMDTLKGLNQSWPIWITWYVSPNASSFVIFITILFIIFTKTPIISPKWDLCVITDRAADGQSPVSAGAVDSV